MKTQKLVPWDWKFETDFNAETQMSQILYQSHLNKVQNLRLLS